MIYLWVIQSPFHSPSSHLRTCIWVAWWKAGKNDAASFKHRLKVNAAARGTSMLSLSAITACVPGVSPCSIVHPWDAVPDPWTQVAEAAAVLRSSEGEESALPVPVPTNRFIMNPSDTQQGHPTGSKKSWLRFGNPQRFHHTQISKAWHLKQEARVPSLANRREILQESCVYLRANWEMGAAEGKRSWCHREYQLEIALDFSSIGAETEWYFRISLRNYLGELSIIMLSKMIPVAHAGHKVC